MNTQAQEAVLYSAAGGVAQITLNRPDRLNASNRALSQGLTAAFTRAAVDPQVRVVLLAGAGRAFCAGADLQVLDEISAGPDAAHSGSNGLRYDGITRLEKPVVAAIRGACAGIGLALACAADIRIAAEDAVFVAPFVKLGLPAEGGLAWLLSHAMGPGNAAELLLSARRMGAGEALAKGLVAHVLPVEGFGSAMLAYAQDLASGAPASFAAIKKQIFQAATHDFATAQDHAATLALTMLQGHDFREAVAARREGRVPAFAPIAGRFDPPVSEG
ncbi:enoyl-CoA hydratase/carnithine racemase [Novosphingobium taihuense]|nr:enoyl-CoA hydratase/carnithine racemase [Novosphingobium taihuense]